MICPDLQITDCIVSLTVPRLAKVQVVPDSRVSKGDVLAIEEESIFQEFDMAGFNLLVSLGSKVGKDQILASKKGLLGKTVEFRSPVEGTPVEISDKGILKIRTKEEKKEILSPVDGIIKEVKSPFIVLQFEGLKITGDWGQGPRVFGIMVILGAREEEVSFQDLKQDMAEKILVIGGKIPLGVYHKAEALGVLGILGNSVAEEVPADDLAIVTLGDKDGFIPLEIWKELEKRKGREVLISGNEKYLAIFLK